MTDGPDAEAAWISVVALVDAADVEVVSGRLWSAGVAGIEEREVPGSPGTVEVVACAPAGAAGALVAAMGDGVGTRVVAVGHSGGRLDPWAVGRRDVPVAPRVVVSIDPGGAFGHGGHVTTRLALRGLVAAVGPGTGVLDVGSGSGILAVAAARLGAAPVAAVDVDPAARSATAANAAANGVEVTVVEGGLDAVDGRFDLVVANVEAPVLVELGPALAARVAPDGSAVVAGFLAPRAEAVVAALAPLQVVDRRTEADWVCLTLRRP